MKKIPLYVMEAITCRKLVIITSVNDTSYSDGKVYSEVVYQPLRVELAYLIYTNLNVAKVQ